MVDLRALCADLRSEHESLDDIVSGLDDASWDAPTPSVPWTVRDQISHLTFFDVQAKLATTDPEAFGESLPEIARDIDGYTNAPLAAGRALPPSGVLSHWRDERAAMLQAFDSLDPLRRVPWYGPPMSSASFVTARLMETWAHGQDVVDALALDRKATDRLRHIAHLGVRARPYGYMVRGREAPDVPVRVELTAPSGDVWTWGPEDASERVIGSALGFCLLVTQRRHVEDTHLFAEGPAASEWLSIAQCFAGPPGEGRKPGQFAKGRV